MGFRTWWRWKSHNPGGRPEIDQEPRDLVGRMCEENPLWGAPRIHGELLKLGFDVAQSTVSKYMLRRRGPPSQGWKTFLRNHADGIVCVDFLIVPTRADIVFGRDNRIIELRLTVAQCWLTSKAPLNEVSLRLS